MLCRWFNSDSKGWSNFTMLRVFLSIAQPILPKLKAVDGLPVSTFDQIWVWVKFRLDSSLVSCLCSIIHLIYTVVQSSTKRLNAALNLSVSLDSSLMGFYCYISLQLHAPKRVKSSLRPLKSWADHIDSNLMTSQPQVFCSTMPFSYQKLLSRLNGMMWVRRP